MDTDLITSEVSAALRDLTLYSEAAQGDAFLRCYAEIPEFLAVSGDGMVRNYQGFSKICKDYYDALQQQKLSTIHEIFHVLDESTVVLCWSGNIDAYFKNGDRMKMPNYTVTYLFKKMGGEWKIIHSHESALPPETIRST
jgi:ketosteroid isomerase-like protein